MIEGAIGYCIDALKEGTGFGYTRDQTIDIVSRAIASYLDERFSISDRKLLGWG